MALAHREICQAEIDVPEDVVDFITQRRRLLNGTFAATCYSLMHFNRLYSSSHSIIRMFMLHIQLIYNTVSFVLSWFNLAVFLLTIFIVTAISGSPPKGLNIRPFPFGALTPIVNAII